MTSEIFLFNLILVAFNPKVSRVHSTLLFKVLQLVLGDILAFDFFFRVLENVFKQIVLRRVWSGEHSKFEFIMLFMDRVASKAALKSFTNALAVQDAEATDAV